MAKKIKIILFFYIFLFCLPIAASADEIIIQQATSSSSQLIGSYLSGYAFQKFTTASSSPICALTKIAFNGRCQSTTLAYWLWRVYENATTSDNWTYQMPVCAGYAAACNSTSNKVYTSQIDYPLTNNHCFLKADTDYYIAIGGNNSNSWYVGYDMANANGETFIMGNNSVYTGYNDRDFDITLYSDTDYASSCLETIAGAPDCPACSTLPLGLIIDDNLIIKIITIIIFAFILCLMTYPLLTTYQ